MEISIRLITIVKSNLASRNFGLDLMRALAIILVVYSHYLEIIYPYLNPFFANFTFSLGNFVGVTMFFVLSGFLIGKIFIDSFSKPNFGTSDLMTFWTRRWLRTLPNYYFFLLLLLVIAIVLNRIPPASVILKYLTFSQNLFTKTDRFFLQAWSLSVEEWFYLTFPLMVFLLHKMKVNKETCILSAIIIVILFSGVSRFLAFNSGLKVEEMQLMIPFRVDGIIYGVLTAYLFYRNKPTQKMSWFLMAIGFTLLILLCLAQVFFVLVSKPNEIVRVALLYVIPVPFALMLPALYSFKVQPGTISRFITLTSIASYSIYLNHFVILEVLKMFESSVSLYAFLLFFIGVITTFLVSIFQYRFIEMPVLELRDRKIPTTNNVL